MLNDREDTAIPETVFVESTLNERTMRGALKISVDTSRTMVRAGESFSVFVTIENPYDTPVIIRAVETHLPIELCDLWGDYLTLCRYTEIQEKQITDASTRWIRMRLRLFFGWKNIVNARRKKHIPQIAQAYSTTDTSFSGLPSSKLHISADGASTVAISNTIVSDMTITLNPLIAPHDVQTYVYALAALRHQLPKNDEIVLRPGNSIVKQFLFQTRRWLLFTPFRHRLMIQTHYFVDNASNYDTTPYDLDIRASLVATILGGMLGGLLGALTRLPTITTWTDANSLFSALLSSIFGAITILAFARKSDTQPLVSVEDFLGGLLLGFVVGYTGNTLFQQIVQGFTIKP